MEFDVVVGSWYAYNEANEKGLGSEWIDFAKYNSWDEIAEELKKQGFDLEGEDEELFVQDVDFEMPKGISYDNTNPEYLFKILKTSGVMDKEYTYHEMLAYCDVETWDDFCELVEKNGSNWDMDIIFREDSDGSDWARDEIMEWLPQEYFKLIDNYLDYDKYFEESDAHETKWGVILLI